MFTCSSYATSEEFQWLFLIALLVKMKIKQCVQIHVHVLNSSFMNAKMRMNTGHNSAIFEAKKITKT